MKNILEYIHFFLAESESAKYETKVIYCLNISSFSINAIKFILLSKFIAIPFLSKS